MAQYRQRHAQYKSDADLQAAHTFAPWLVVWDDHEVENNWADDVPENTDAGHLNDTPAHPRQRRAAAFQALHENMPLRALSVPAGFDMKHSHSGVRAIAPSSKIPRASYVMSEREGSDALIPSYVFLRQSWEETAEALRQERQNCYGLTLGEQFASMPELWGNK